MDAAAADENAPSRAALDRAYKYLDAGADFVHRAREAQRAGDETLRSLFAMEAELAALDFEQLPDDERALVLWLAFWQHRTRTRPPRSDGNRP